MIKVEKLDILFLDDLEPMEVFKVLDCCDDISYMRVHIFLIP